MPKPVSVIATQLTTRLTSFEHSRTKIEALYTKGQIGKRDLHLFYEGMFLKTVTTFEGFLEDLFIGLVSGKLTPSSKVIAQVTFRSSAMARQVISGGNPYADWLPYRHTKKRAPAYFRNGYPFTNLTKAEIASLERIIAIRHAIAHQSTAAMKRFKNEVLGATNRLASEKSPAGFLRSNIGITPPRTQYEDIAVTCSLIARKLVS